MCLVCYSICFWIVSEVSLVFFLLCVGGVVCVCVCCWYVFGAFLVCVECDFSVYCNVFLMCFWCVFLVCLACI